jgi:glucuronoarabinoxylan endo-1,4-beta-xylanase
MRKEFVFILVFLLGTRLLAQEVVKVDFTQAHQQIDGFGASTAWHGKLSDKEFDTSFGNGENQLGLSILRVRIDPAGENRWGDELANAQKAIARGAIVFASPWTPPASMKNNNNTVGGQLNQASYYDYVAYLNGFIDYMEEKGAPIYAISLQNEPNIKVTYESCNWTPAQLLDFCTNNAQDIKVPVIMPEAYNFDFAYSNPVLNDSTAASHISIIGGHLYGATPKVYPLAAEKGKKVWMTEKFFDPDDISTCISIAKEISDCMNSNMNAYIWWYLRQPSCNLINSGGNSIKKKGYVMAQFSKFVRPGYHRTDAAYAANKGINITAYKGDKQVIVAINQSTKVKTVQFEITGDSTLYFQQYTTSSTKSLKKESTVEVKDHIVTVDLEPQSVTTFIGTNEAYSSVGVDKIQTGAKVLVYPNPSPGGITLTTNLNAEEFPLSMRILSLDGKKVYEQTINSDNLQIETGLKPSIYLLRVTGNTFSYNQQLIIK